MKRLIVILVGLAGLLFFAGAVIAQEVETQAWRHGDDGAWLPLSSLDPGYKGVFWVRTTITPASFETGHAALRVTSNIPLDVYWNGEHLGDNEAERGVFDRVLLMIPAGWRTVDTVQVQLRADSANLAENEEFYLSFEVVHAPADIGLTRLLDWLDGAAIVLSAFLAVVFLALWWLRRHRTDFGLTASISLVAAAIVILDNNGRDFVLPSGTAVEIGLRLGAILLAILLPVAYFLRLKPGPAWHWGAGFVGVLAASFAPLFEMDHDARAFLWISGFLVVMSLASRPVIAVPWAVRAAYALAALVMAMAVLLWPDRLTLFLVVLVVLVATSLLIDVIARELASERNAAQLDRLRLALVKRNIQPHFIMNSLTVALELQDEDPASAKRFVDALSGEFRALSRILEKDQITLEEEIELCRLHLSMMGTRLGRDFDLKATVPDLLLLVPPGILHTLVENAISHNRYKQARIEFHLDSEVLPRGHELVLRVPCSNPRSVSPVSTGSGSAYIETRLEAFAPGEWEFTSAAEEGSWVTRIRLPGERRSSDA